QCGEEFRRLSQTLPGLLRGEIEAMGIRLSFSRAVPLTFDHTNGSIVTSVVRQMNRGCPRPSNNHLKIVALRFGAFLSVSASRLSPLLRGGNSPADRCNLLRI